MSIRVIEHAARRSARRRFEAARTAHDGLVDEDWLRCCALCGAVDSEHAWPAPADDGEGWCCPRCEAVRWLWVTRPAAEGKHRRG